MFAVRSEKNRRNKKQIISDEKKIRQKKKFAVSVRPRIRKFPVLKLALPVLVRVPVLVRADPRSSTGIAF